MNNFPPSEPFPAARFIKEIGRGKDGARSLSRNDAHDLYAAMLDGRVSDLEMGGILLAMRIKGESVEEIDGFLQAAEASFTQISLPDNAGNSSWAYAPVVIPSYNGARHMANLTPLLAMLLAREGVPVLLHGVSTDPGRVTSAEIFQALGQPAYDLFGCPILDVERHDFFLSSQSRKIGRNTFFIKPASPSGSRSAAG